MESDDKAPFTDHLGELRSRLIKCFIGIAMGFIVAYIFKEKLFEILTQPLISVLDDKDTLIFTGLPEAFFTYLKVALLGGIMLAAPFLIYQFWMFVAPGLYDKERGLMIPILFLSTLFFLGGALFGYFVVFPFGFKFFLGFSTDTIRPYISMKEYLSFASKLLLAFGVVFELPLVLYILVKLNVLSIATLKNGRRHAVIIMLIIGALLSPPDPGSSPRATTRTSR